MQGIALGLVASAAAIWVGCSELGDLYLCDKAFGDKPNLCAAMNRGMVADPANPDNSTYYRSAPDNTYAAWVHGICPGVYAFPYDDARAAEDAFHTCRTIRTAPSSTSRSVPPAE